MISFSMRKLLLSITLLLCLSTALPAHRLKEPLPAIVVVPVAELATQPLLTGLPLKEQTEQNPYRTLPYSIGKPFTARACRRGHQALFNEQVNILEIRGAEARVEVLNILMANQEPATFWVLRENIASLSSLKKKGVDLSKFPPPVLHRTPASVYASSDVVVLKLPYRDPLTSKVYSVGTRFLIQHHDLQQSSYRVYNYDPQQHKFQILRLPGKACHYNYGKSAVEKRRDFLKLLRQWSSQKRGVIPYVLGGASWTHLAQDKQFSKEKVCEDNTTGIFYYRGNPNDSPKTGMDCSGMIMRAAQICGIPFFYKNTSAMQQLPALQKEELLQEGDLVLVPGHVIVVSDLKTNRFIQAAGYERYGNGKVHESALSAMFPEIKSYQQLRQAYLSGTRISDTGQLVNVKIVKLEAP